LEQARRVAKSLLLGPWPERWGHTQGVAERATELTVTVPVEDRSVLIAAAWLHDIGYAPPLTETASTRWMARCTSVTGGGTSGWSRWSRIILAPG
jgi:HD superfamily phosphohydrolase YqeK